jgi:putative phage-type endonuclease
MKKSLTENRNIEQRSEAWFEQRRGKLTGSNIGAALGVNPWKTPEDLIRQMVRSYHGAESEFTGNIATEYGTLHEPLATMEYFGKTSNFIEECGFFVHPGYEWLGASPDGLLGENGVIEIKCPFGLRNHKKPEFKTAEQQPHYYAQMQIEMACTGRKYCDFYQWAKYGDSLETVEFNHSWFHNALPQLKAFHDRYLSELDNPEHLEPKQVEINTLATNELIEEYDSICATIDEATARKKEILATLVESAKSKNAVICGRKLTKVERKGSIGYAKIVKEKLPELDLEPYTGKATSYWKLS